MMSCDLLGSMALPSRLDPEDLREITVAFHRAVADVVAGFEALSASTSATALSSISAIQSFRSGGTRNGWERSNGT